jgi:HAD superfamily hydrolase (TIGR01509 family)
MNPPAPRISAVVFDLDGTLVETFRIYGDVYRKTFARATGKILTDAEIFSLGPAAEPLTIQKVVGETKLKRYMDFFCEQYEAELVKSSRLVYPGVAELIEWCAQRGMALGIYTNKSQRTAEMTLARIPFARHFRSVVTANHVSEPKPHPEGVIQSLELLKAAPHETLYVGDWPVDVLAGQRAGVRTGLALWGHSDLQHPDGHHLPDFILESPAQLIRLLEEPE